MAQVHRVERDPQRLQHGPVGVAERVRERHETTLRPGQPFPEAAIVGSVPREAGPFAKVGVAFEAEVASEARDGGVQGHAPSVVGDPGTLVAEDEGPDERDLADPSLGEPVEVGAAEADRGDPHQRLAFARLWPLLLVQAHVAFPVEAEATHYRWP
jgi:hypothetical protein